MSVVTRITLAAAMGWLPAVAVFAQGQPSKPQQPQAQQQQQKQKPEKAEVGAGTRDDTTTGSSGPQAKGSKGEPPLPGPALCKSYQGKVQQDCLATVLRNDGRAQQSGGAGGPQPKSGGATGNNNGG